MNEHRHQLLSTLSLKNLGVNETQVTLAVTAIISNIASIGAIYNTRATSKTGLR